MRLSKSGGARRLPELQFALHFALHLVEMTGFEPATPCLQSRRSPTELHPPAGGGPR